MQDIADFQKLLEAVALGFVARHIYRSYVQTEKFETTIELIWCLIWSIVIHHLAAVIAGRQVPLGWENDEDLPVHSLVLSTILWTCVSILYVKVRSYIYKLALYKRFLYHARTFDSLIHIFGGSHTSSLRSMQLSNLENADHPDYMLSTRVVMSDGTNFLGEIRSVDSPLVKEGKFIQLDTWAVRSADEDFTQVSRMSLIRLDEVSSIQYEFLEKSSTRNSPDSATLHVPLNTPITTTNESGTLTTKTDIFDSEQKIQSGEETT